MSAKIAGQCWELDIPHEQMLVLQAMADHADHEGRNLYPSLRLIAWKTGYSERQVRRVVDALEARGLLVAEERADGQAVRYRIELAGAPRKVPFRAVRGRPRATPAPREAVQDGAGSGQNVTGFCQNGARLPEKPLTSCQKGVTSCHKTPDILSKTPDISAPRSMDARAEDSEPSVNLEEEPSEEPPPKPPAGAGAAEIFRAAFREKFPGEEPDLPARYVELLGQCQARVGRAKFLRAVPGFFADAWASETGYNVNTFLSQPADRWLRPAARASPRATPATPAGESALVNASARRAERFTALRERMTPAQNARAEAVAPLKSPANGPPAPPAGEAGGSDPME